MQYTSNYRLKKQELTDKADITQISENWDTIDSELATVDGKSGGAITGDVEINGNLSTEGFNTKLDYIKGQTPAEPKNATWNIFDSENNRVARVQFNISESGVPSIGMYVNKNNDAVSEDSTGVVCQWNDVTPKVSITHNPDKAANDKQIATTSWVKSQIATASEYGLVKLADEQAFLMPKDPDYAINVPLTYKVNGFRGLNTAYEVGDRVACAFKYNLFLECTQAGTTNEEMLDTRNVTHGQVINDGTVQWTVRTHVRSINNLVADANGNVDAGGISDLDKIYPVGSIYMSMVNVNPSELFGGTWEALNEGRVLIGANDTYPVGTKGGEETHTLNVNEMPSHYHIGYVQSTGTHNHYLVALTKNDADENPSAYNYIAYQSVSRTLTDRDDYYLKGVRQVIGSTVFGGKSTEGGDHSHGLSINYEGGSLAHNNMQPYLAVYMWHRVA